MVSSSIKSNDRMWPTKNCAYGAASTTKTSKTVANPMRDFYSCAGTMGRQCNNFVQWCDENVDPVGHPVSGSRSSAMDERHHLQEKISRMDEEFNSFKYRFSRMEEEFNSFKD
ncbi:hypothetical protein HHK36_026150 [Tetracentron sinense]|uniref:GRF-type domain-containing protein n=1 Tax=Tetracentron sinense TaxID=13715 RepID=A0A834YK47_TETSI|nr:hypothetical protein HHK36_026150 [Tetracentron sinense]